MMPSESDPYAAAAALADELCDELGTIYDHLVLAIYAYRAASGDLPTPAQVREYVRRVRDRGEWVSGKGGRAAPIRPIERWQGDGFALELRQRPRGGQRRSQAWVVVPAGHRGPEDLAHVLASYRTRSRCVRWLDEHHPVGEWTISLPTNERARVLALWT